MGVRVFGRKLITLFRLPLSEQLRMALSASNDSVGVSYRASDVAFSGEWFIEVTPH